MARLAAGLILCLAGAPAFAQEQVRVNSTHPFDLFEVWPGALDYRGFPAEMAWSNSFCTTHFVPTTRVYEPAPEAPLRTAEVFSYPACRFRTGAVGPYAIVQGQMTFRSIRDQGTYMVTCSDLSPASMHCTPTAEPDACGRRELCVPAFAGTRQTRIFTFEVFNQPPYAAITVPQGSLNAGAWPVNETAVISASPVDPDGGTPPRVSFEVTPPRPGATVTRVTGSTGTPTLALGFRTEADFGEWRVTVLVDDDEGERVRQSVTILAANRRPAPVIAGPARVPFGSPVMLEVSADEDGGTYEAVTWEALPPTGGSMPVSPVAGDPRRIVMPTTIASAGTWTFRAMVTDNELPALSGTSQDYTVEI